MKIAGQRRRRRRAYRFFSLPRPFCPSFGRGAGPANVSPMTQSVATPLSPPPYSLEKSGSCLSSSSSTPIFSYQKKDRPREEGKGEREAGGGCLRTSGSYRSIERGNRDYLLSTAVRGCGRVSRFFVSLAIDSNQSASLPIPPRVHFFPYKPRVLTRRRRRPLSPRRNSVAGIFFVSPPFFDSFL
jgi:hypothetical protein